MIASAVQSDKRAHISRAVWHRAVVAAAPGERTWYARSVDPVRYSHQHVTGKTNEYATATTTVTSARKLAYVSQGSECGHATHANARENRLTHHKRAHDLAPDVRGIPHQQHPLLVQAQLRVVPPGLGVPVLVHCGPLRVVELSLTRQLLRDNTNGRKRSDVNSRKVT